jgi:uncharacterized protein (TIGR03435 family)
MTRSTVFLPLFFFAFLTASTGRAQSSRPAFDVASVKPNPNCQIGVGRAAISPRNLALPCASLRALIRIAYGEMLVGAGLGARRMEVQGGPGWLDTDRYDVLAKSESNAIAQSVAPMLQTLLEERFNVKVHKEARDSSVYILTVADGGPKLQPTKEGSCSPMDLNNLQPPKRPKPGEPMPRYCGAGGQRTSKGSRSAEDWYGVTMSELAGRMLPGKVDLPVVDKTGLAERFDVHIEFVHEYHVSGPVTLNGVVTPDVPEPPAGDSSGPSIFSALEKQLGLKLSPGKAPLDVIIVDHAEKPSAN